jgi:hypothetical protein
MENSSYLQGVFSRISIPGLIFILAGAAVCFGAHRLAPRLFKANADNAVLPLKLGGLLLAFVGVALTLIF